MSMELTDELVQTYHHNCSQPHQLVIDDEIEKLLKKNVITRCDNEEKAIISPISSKKKPNDSFRLLLNIWLCFTKRD